MGLHQGRNNNLFLERYSFPKYQYNFPKFVIILLLKLELTLNTVSGCSLKTVTYIKNY